MTEEEERKILSEKIESKDGIEFYYGMLQKAKRYFNDKFGRFTNEDLANKYYYDLLKQAFPQLFD